MQRGKDVMFPCDQCYYKATQKTEIKQQNIKDSRLL